MQTCILYAAMHNPEYTMNAAIQPLALDPMLQSGAVLLGVPVVRVLIEWPDGRKMRIDLPSPTLATSERTLVGAQLKMISVLSRSPLPLSRKQLAKAMNRQSAEGKFGVQVNDLLSRNLIIERNGMLTDVVDKYENA